MKGNEDILKTGTLYWFKSNRRGKVPVPIKYLTEEQRQILISGLTNNKFELCNPYHYFTEHYMWLNEDRNCFFLVSDIKIAPGIKRRTSPRKLIGKKEAYRITLSEMKRLKNDLICGRVDEKYVEFFLTKTKWKPWTEKEWKSNRDNRIGESCNYCNNHENLVLQHTLQPRKINAIKYELVGERFEEFQLFVKKNKENFELNISKDVAKVPVCPKCGSSQIHLRIRGVNKGTYVCNKSKNYVKCKHEFSTPNYGHAELDIKNAKKNRVKLLHDKFCKVKGLLRKAVEISLEEIITYLNLDNTITLCRKCAFKEDKPFDKYY